VCTSFLLSVVYILVSHHVKDDRCACTHARVCVCVCLCVRGDSKLHQLTSRIVA
jgi:hypothetical protein